MDKVIATNFTALAAKYGAGGVAKITAAVKTLIAADAKLGIKSRLVGLDRAADMKPFGKRIVTDPGSERQNKEAIDTIFGKADPDYLLILGAPDVVPHQDTKNPAFDAPDDPDEFAWGDLPYACDAGYSRDIATFKGPTRVVGRLPDLTNAKEPSHLIALLNIAAKAKPRDPKDYAAYFALSTQSWRKSTELNLETMFGNAASLTLAPPAGPTHSAKLLAPLLHFINCHGGPSDPTFYGEKGNSMPPSLTSNAIVKKINVGTLAAVECCYGAELYDAETLATAIPICQRYLRQGAWGYFGSSTIAYGPPDKVGIADLITQYFVTSVLEGASLGRAALIARQRYVEQTGELDPVDLKTLAQFILLGDPSLVPVKVPQATEVPKGANANRSYRLELQQRRAKLRITGELLKETKPTASKKARKVKKSVAVRKALANIADEAGIGTKKEFTAFDVKTPRGARARLTKSTPLASRYYVAVYRPKGANSRSIAAVAKEVAGRITGYRIYREKS